jgi:hypothetical protein
MGQQLDAALGDCPGGRQLKVVCSDPVGCRWVIIVAALTAFVVIALFIILR